MTVSQSPKPQGDRRSPETRRSITLKLASDQVDRIHEQARLRGATVADYIWALVVDGAGPARDDDPIVKAMLEETETLCAPRAEMTTSQRAALLLHKVRIVKAIRQYAGSVPPQEWGVLLGIARELQDAGAASAERAVQFASRAPGARKAALEPQPADAVWAAAAEELARQIEEAQARARAALEGADGAPSRKPGTRPAPQTAAGRPRRTP